jgi:endo-1,4-beta-xylanase
MASSPSLALNRRTLLRRGVEFANAVAMGAAMAARAVSSDTEAFQPLKTFGAPCGLRIGAQSDIGPLKDAGFAQLVRDNFNLLTPGNQLKWGYVHPKPDVFAFDDADWMVQFAKTNGMLVHGHNLCWNYTGNSWLDQVLTPRNARQYLTEHIRTVAGRYRGQIDSWDVVNEPIAPWSRRSDGLYPGIWLNLLGSEYIDIAFAATAEADPRALRVLNLHHVETSSPDDVKNRKSAVALLRQLIQRRVPLQAVGLESHLTGGVPLGGPDLANFIRDIREMGLEVLITECDVIDTQLSSDENTRDDEVAKCYGDYIKQVIPGTGIRSFIFFTPCDRFSWVNSPRLKDPQFLRKDGKPQRPGLFDVRMKAKPAFRAASSAFSAVCKNRA